MITNVGHRKYRVFAFDVESHNDPISIALRDTSIWLYSFIDESSDKYDDSCYGSNLHQFLEVLYRLSCTKRKAKNNLPKNLLIYIFNMSFEWSFLLPVILAHGFKYKEKIEKDDEYVYNTISTKTASSVWVINLKFAKNGGVVTFRDLNKMFNGSLAEVAKSFGLATQKGEIDYEKNRRPASSYVPTQKEKIYNFNDTKIIMDILEEMQKRWDKDFFSSLSISTYSMKKMLKVGYPHTFKVMKRYRREDQYPILDQVENDFTRKSLEGGICYAPVQYQYKNIKTKVAHIDARQMHPTQLATKLFPYGRGEKYEGEYKGPYRICCCHVLISYDYVKLYENIKLIGYPFITDFEMWVWSFEIPTMMKCYGNLKIKYIDGYAYKCRSLPWKEYYKENYRLRKIAKKKKDLFNIDYFKRLNNGSYGKSVENAHNETFENIVDDDGLIDSISHPRDKIEIGGKYAYVPLGSCCTAYSRCCLIETALKIGWKYVTYFDTDSIFFIYNEETKKVLENDIPIGDDLGMWGVEAFIERAQFACPKRYKLETIVGKGDNFLLLDSGVKMAGFNFKGHEATYETNIVDETYEVQRSLRVKGGTIIIFKEKEAKVLAKYEQVYNLNKGLDVVPQEMM